MIKIDVEKKEISQLQITALQKLDSDLTSYIKANLNKDIVYRRLQVAFVLRIIKREANFCRITHNAQFVLQGSFQLVNQIKDFVTKRDDIEICFPNHSLQLSLDFVQKEQGQDDGKTQTDKGVSATAEETVEFTPIDPHYKFEQIILPDELKGEIMNALNVIECKYLIYNQWGFNEVESTPKSIVNFYGPPGTGKTMCAHAIADRLGKKLMALNYSEIESKYVGDAAKNLKKAFDTAVDSDSVLFFDEADSFLGKRIQNVAHGSDQAINSLRSQMLILLEEFSGVVVFATNLVTNFDKAFESRILKHIRFELPNKEARAQIIKKMLPSKLPKDAELTDEQYLEASDLIEGLSGREIKGAILDMLLDKAGKEGENAVFTFEDLKTALSKKKKQLDDLKAEENRMLKERIAKKLNEKAEEAKAEKEMEEKNN